MLYPNRFVLAVAFAASLTSTLFVTPARAAQTQPVTVTAPDMSAYDCTTSTASGQFTSVHLGQVIMGRYYEWHELYSTANGGRALVCISLSSPRAQQLNATQASAFIARSAQVGVPTENTASTPAAANAASHEPANVKPEPRKSANRTNGGQLTLPNATHPLLPAVPATHSNTNGATNPTATTPATIAPTDATSADPRTSLTTSATQAYPYNTIGYLSVTYPDGESFRCSGTVVSAYVVLTAGHCIHNNTRGGYASQIRFYPAQSTSTTGATVTPYGSNANWTNLQTTQAWTQISGPDSFDIIDYANDIAAIQFSTPFTFTSTFMAVVYGSTDMPVINSGYPATVNSSSGTPENQWSMSGSEDSDSIDSLEYYNLREFSIYSTGGDSGSPFFTIDITGRAQMVGTLSYGSDSPSESGGPWYDYWNEELLSSWLQWTPSTATATGLPTDGLHVSSVFSSTQGSSQSYLRFYNTGATAGTVKITLQNYQTGQSLATWNSASIPAGGELQFTISTIEAQASPSFTRPAFYTLSIQPGIQGYFQHVLWHVTDGTLTNISACDTGAQSTYSQVIGVHSSLLSAGYPSTVVVLNSSAQAAQAVLDIYDAATGNQLGTYTTAPIPGFGQVMIPVSTIESTAHITPTATQYHYVVAFDNAFTGFLQNLVNNVQAGVITDMSTACLLPPAQ